MKIYRWERIRNEAAYELARLSGSWFAGSAVYAGLFQSIEQQMTGQPRKSWRENAKEILEKAQDIIDHWDIRLAAKLIELFPNIIAKKYRGQEFTCDMNERGDWCLCFK